MYSTLNYLVANLKIFKRVSLKIQNDIHNELVGKTNEKSKTRLAFNQQQ